MKRPLTAKIIVALITALLAIGFAACSSTPTTAPPTNGKQTPTVTPTATPTGTPPIFTSKCTPAFNDKINADLYTNTDTDSVLGGKKRQFNYFSEDCIVTLYGYLSQAEKEKLETIALAHPYVEGLIRKSLYPTLNDYPSKPSAGACPGDMEPCGEICVPRGQCMTNRPQPSPTPTPSVSPSTKPTKTP